MSGSLVRVTPGGRRPVPRHWVTLHKVTLQAGGPADSVRTDPLGRWRFRIAPVDTTAVYLASATWAGLAYVSRPVHPSDRLVDSVGPLEVYDTTHGRPPIVLTQRFLTIRAREADGTRQVLEIVELSNPGLTTRIAPDTSAPNWTGALPSFAIRFQVGESDVSSETVVRRGSQVAVLAPLSPGTPRQVTFAYLIPAGVREAVFPVDQYTQTLLLAIEDTSLAVSGLPLRDIGTRTLEQGRSFRGFKLDSVSGGGAFTIDLGRGATPVGVYIAVVVGLAAAAMAYGLYRALARRPAPS